MIPTNKKDLEQRGCQLLIRIELFIVFCIKMWVLFLRMPRLLCTLPIVMAADVDVNGSALWR